jgi:dihydromonapterin reductase / dihydrofolate reductase
VSKPRILITGVSRRLGLHLVQEFLRSGWDVIGVTRAVTAELQACVNDNLTLLRVEAYNGQAAERLAEELLGKFNSLDVIVHNASLFVADRNHKGAETVFFQQLFDVHMAFPALLNERLQHVLGNGDRAGNIIHITDIYAQDPSENFLFYCATKAGLENLTKSFALKYAPRIRVNSVLPGPMKFLPEHGAEYQQKVLSNTPLKQEGGFGPLYQAICSIIDNPYITGSSIKVDGGRSLKRW